MRSDDEYDDDLKEPSIKSLQEAIGNAEDLRDFALYHGFEELALSISKTNDLLCALKLNAPKRQMQINDYFKPQIFKPVYMLYVCTDYTCVECGFFKFKRFLFCFVLFCWV